MKTVEQMRQDLAKAFFKDCKNDDDYPHEDAQGQYEEMKIIGGEQITKMHTLIFPEDHEEQRPRGEK